MSDELIVRQCAPTLAGIKTGSLFSYSCIDLDELKKDIVCFNRKYSRKGLCMIPLRIGKSSALLYLYRPNELKKDLNSDSARELLKAAGYECNNCGRCIVHLMKRLCESCEFPHEIGLFLSYPPEDVKGFIENHAANFKCAGLWKVYGDEKKALKLFRRYKHCTNVYFSLLAKGRGIEDLAICS